MEDKLNLTRILEVLRNNVVTTQSFGIKNIGIFGSYVREEQEIMSDLDVLVEFEIGKKNFDNLMNLLHFLEDLFQVKVNLVTKEALSPYIGPSILEEVVYIKE
jgi:predicted nucleotidyltransferase